MLMAQGLIGALNGEVPEAKAAPVQPQASQIDPDATVTIQPGLNYDAAEMTAKRRAMADDCLQPGEQPTSDAETRLKQLYDTMRQSPVGEGIYQRMSDGTRTMCLQDEVAGGVAVYDPQMRASMLPKDGGEYGELTVQELAGHEATHANQSQNPGLEVLRQRNLVDAIALEGILEADAVAHQLAVSWQLEQRGIKGSWDPQRMGGNFKPSADAFQASMERSIAEQGPEASFDNGAIREAMGAAFRGWFENKDLRMVYAERRATQHPLSQAVVAAKQGDGESWKTSLPRPESLVSAIGHVAGDQDGIPYLKTADIERAKDFARQDLGSIEAAADQKRQLRREMMERLQRGEKLTTEPSLQKTP
ncbi:MAG: DUF6782 family putative metallopeptidase [Pseudomonadota bacterium]